MKWGMKKLLLKWLTPRRRELMRSIFCQRPSGYQVGTPNAMYLLQAPRFLIAAFKNSMQFLLQLFREFKSAPFSSFLGRQCQVSCLLHLQEGK